MALTQNDVLNLKKEFPALQVKINDRPIAFFDGPGGTQVHGSVIEAMTWYLTEANSNSHGNYLHSRRTDEITQKGREAMADMLNAKSPSEIVFGPNMTTLTFRMSQAIGQTLKPGDEVVVTHLDHDANVAPWLSLEKLGVVVRWVDFTQADCRLDMESLKKAIGPRTKVVAVGYASNAIGTLNDVKTAIKLAHENGAWAYIDAVHYAPHGPIDVQDLDCDFLACSAYKFFGPHLGCLYGRHELLEALPATKVRPADDNAPDKYETGTNNFEAITGMTAAVNYLASIGRRFGEEFKQDFPGFADRRLELKAGMAAIRAYEFDLCRHMMEKLAQMPEITVYGPPADSTMRVPTLAIRSSVRSPEEIAQKLGDLNIYAWDGHFYALEAITTLGLLEKGGVVRIGICHYNTLADVDALIDALAAMHR